MLRRRAPIVALLLIAALLVLAACEKPVESRVVSPRPIVAIELEWTDPGVELELTGVVEPWNVEDIAFEVGGRLDYVVEAGTLLEGRWQEGQELISRATSWRGSIRSRSRRRCASPEPMSRRRACSTRASSQPRIKAANAMLVQEQQEYDRRVEAAKTNAVSGLDVVRAKAALDSAKANVEQFEAEKESAAAALARAEATREQRELDLTNAELFAPFDGEVSETYVRAGGYAGPASPLRAS